MIHFPLKTRLVVPMVCYAALALLAAFTLDDLRFRIMVWLVLGMFAVKTWIRVSSSED